MKSGSFLSAGEEYNEIFTDVYFWYGFSINGSTFDVCFDRADDMAGSCTTYVCRHDSLVCRHTVMDEQKTTGLKAEYFDRSMLIALSNFIPFYGENYSEKMDCVITYYYSGICCKLLSGEGNYRYEGYAPAM